ncbi:MAG TPA: tetratricopeptide repeat protein [Candidatus Acidoferrum sp.]|nr:tetratricopeptide repeat protein [Candidatus Acidoferrum sp.]
MPERRKWEPAAVCYCLLALITLAVYLPVLEARFVTFDDTYYVTDNQHVQAGLTWEGTRWAFTHYHAANWHPVTWLSHMLDCQLYGLNPLGPHLTNLLFHTANTLLLFGLLRYLTGAFWRSAFVAALFALHPLHVESVAWVAERKDVLSTFFFLLTLWTYVRYAEARTPKVEGRIGKHPTANIQHPTSSDQPQAGSTRHAPRFYLLSLLFFALGLMSKPMLVTVPFVLLLLDYWPVRRFAGLESQVSNLKPTQLATRTTPQAHGWRQARKSQIVNRILLDKLPFLALSAASCIVTVIAQHKGGALASLEGGSAVSIACRIVNTPVAYASYLAKLLWPADLAVIYPFVREWPADIVVLATAVVVALTGAAVWLGLRRRPYLLVGWLWYLGTLVPVIGLVKVGAQSIADRYMYIPSIGLFVMLAWGVADLTAGWAQRTVPLALAAAAVLAACGIVTGAQLLYWQNTETLFRHALAVTKDNYMACNNLGYYFAELGEHEQAKTCYRQAIQIAPTYPAPRSNLGATLIHQQKYSEAVAALEEALALNPASADIESNLGGALYCEGKTADAITHLRRAIQLNPEYAMARYNLGNALLQQDKPTEAAAAFRQATKLDPRYADAYSNLGLILAKEGKSAEAEAQFRHALNLQPGLAPALYSLGQTLLEQGKADEAAAQFTELLRLHPRHQPAWMQLGLARVKQGNPDEAAAAFSSALRISPDDLEAHCQLGAVLASQHRSREAVQHYREALKLAPDSPEILNNLAWILAAGPNAQVRNGKDAVALAERACKLTDYKRPVMVGTLAAAYAEAGRFQDAVATAEKAGALAEQSNQPALAARNRELAALYRSGQPARDTQ